MAERTERKSDTQAKDRDQDHDVKVPDSEALGLDKGYIGVDTDPIPNERYSLESGPDSPTALEQIAAGLEAQAEQVRNSGTEAPSS